MKSRISRFFQNFFFLLCVGILVAVLYAWVGLWIPKNHIGIFYETEGSEPVIITRLDIKRWYWKRIIPYQSKLISLPLSIQVKEKSYSFYLPNASFESIVLNVPKEQFNTGIDARLLYSIDKARIAEFVTRYFNTPNTYVDTKSVLTILSERIDSTMFSSLQNAVEDSLEIQSITKENWNSEITRIVNTAVATTLSTLPIHTQEILVYTTQTPDLELYNLVRNLDNNQSTGGSTLKEEDTKVQWLNQYLFLINKLGELSAKNPSVIDIIKALPPTVFTQSGSIASDR